MRKSIFVVLSALVVSLSCRTVQDRELAIEQRDLRSNGIRVGTPKVYDDALLQQHLMDAQLKLAGLQVVDQVSITGKLGGIVGGRQDSLGIAVSVTGMPAPGVVTTANGSTEQTTVDATGTAVTTTAPVVNTVTTAPQVTATAPLAPTPSASLPTPVVSASSILNEQQQLASEIANLRLLLDGSLTDRTVSNGGQRFLRPRLTIGFPIQVKPERRFKGAVAVVEVEVDVDPDNDFSQKDTKEPPAITALLPREKSYNVAAIKERSSSIGAGVVTQVASVGASLLRGHKTYYIVQDQDTLALLFEPEKAGGGTPRAGFGWQFRPVLGQASVTGELRETFVQLAFPGSASAPVYGTVHVRTYWRKYDRNRGLIGGIVPESLNENYPPVKVPNFEITMKQDLGSVGPADLEDLGGGQMLVRLDGRFAAGSRIRVGNTLLQPGAGMSFDYNLIRFTSSIVDLATKAVALVSRDGTETPLIVKNAAIAATLDERVTLEVEAPRVAALDETNSLLEISTNQDVERLVSMGDGCPQKVKFPPLVVVVGGKVFGYSDAPVKREGKKLSVVVPTALLPANGELTVKPILADPAYAKTRRIFDLPAMPERLVLIGQVDENRTYLLYGKGIKPDEIVSPASVHIDASSSDGFLRRITLTAAAIDAANKLLVVQRADEAPILVSIPVSAEPPKPVPPRFRERVAVGSDEAVIVGDGLDDVTEMIALDKHFVPKKDGKSLRIKGLAAEGVTGVARVIDCQLLMKGKSVTIQLEVVTSVVETVTRTD